MNSIYSIYRVFFAALSLLGLTILAVSCTADDSTVELSEGRDAVIRLQIKPDTSGDGTTRSIDEDKISDLHVLVYSSVGELTGKSYTTFSGTTYTVSVLARSGAGCKIYVIANTGSPTLFDGAVASSETKLKAITTNLATWSTFNNTSGTVYLPMSGSTTTDISAGSTSLQGGITVKRIVAKITLNVSVDSGSGVTIFGYCLYGIPGRSYYVAHPLSTEDQTTDSQTTRATDASLPVNSGNWTNSGMVSLSNVASFNTSFYMYENRPGVNTAISVQNQKTKTNAPATPADSAAYVIIYGRATGYSRLSWKIYLGANNTTNFNIKRNNKYAYTITLKPNESDTRINYKRLIWAGSNIYWDGSKLTFDPSPADPANPTTQELANMKKQGVAFQWGSLVGISLYGTTNVTYTPTYNSTTPSSSTWSTGSTTYTSIPYITDTGSAYGQANTFLSDAAQNTNANYTANKGDICQYLTKIGAVSGSWRMPTMKEYNSANLSDGSLVSWTTVSTPWAKFGSFSIETGNAQGTTQLSSGGTYTVSGASNSFPVSGYRSVEGLLYNVGQGGNYWSSSVNSATNGYSLNFSTNNVFPANSYSRLYGFTVRCVQY